MASQYIFLLSLVFVAICSAAAQVEDELQIPVENDNQFPPDKHSDILEGSGYGVIEEPETVAETTESVTPSIEHMEPKKLIDDLGAETPSEGDDLCPKPCVCHIEGTSNDFIVDCSGYDLTEFPTPINEKTTVLNIQNNKLSEIPKEISALKNLKVLNANNNNLINLASGSVSELPELVTLKLGNNRLIEFPNDLKNSFGLIKLEELDLGGNDMRTPLTSELFSKFESLQKVILPTSTEDLQKDLCDALPSTLETVCTESCEKQIFECHEDEDNKIDEELPVLPGMIIFPNEGEENADPVLSTPKENEFIPSTEKNTLPNDALPKDTENSKSPAEFSFRSAINKQPSDVAPLNSIVETPKDIQSSSEAPVGATTSDTKTGGVDKSIIGLVVAGMVVIVAGITIKKNWSSIKNRFSSNSRTPNERNGISVNGTAPEEVPLQDKSPV